MLANSQLHHTQVAQYRVDLLQIQRAHGYLPGPGAVQPAAFVQADLALDARYLAEAVRLHGIDQQHVALQAQAAAAQPAVAPAQPRPPRTPAVPLAPNHRFGLWVMAFVVLLIGILIYFHERTPTPSPTLSAADVQKMIDAQKQQGGNQTGAGTGQQQVPKTAAEIAAAAYLSLGPTPDGRKVVKHSVQNAPGYKCDDGTDAVLKNTATSPGFKHYRYYCPNEVRKN